MIERLAKHERESTIWQKVVGYINTEIERLQRSNESLLGPEETNLLRGRIAALRKQLNDLDPPAIDAPEEPTPYDS